MLEKHESLDSSSSNETEEARISQYKVGPFENSFLRLILVQHELSLANHEKDEAVKALRIAEVRPRFISFKRLV